ncbi:MAG TPA: hypothetical protein VLS89_05540 [Candidatus Nanopelagicales bacterium]|nr:hypothetical protein [Candidatus Nanopelagicales bacterium]
MRSLRALPCSSAALAVLLCAGVVSANSDIQTGVPNSDCTHCHANNMNLGDSLTRFGSDFTGLGAMPRTAAATTKWAEIATIDHDCDGVSSGLELGECGQGETPRTTGITNPADASDATTETLPECAVTEALCPLMSSGAGPAAEHPPFPQGFCTIGRGEGAGGSWSLGALVVGAATLLVARQRHHRRPR